MPYPCFYPEYYITLYHNKTEMLNKEIEEEQKKDKGPTKISLSGSCHTRLKDLNKEDRKRLGRNVSLSETIEIRIK